MTHATFFLSTGRCGTQWAWKNLEEVYADLAVVTHEPILRNYTPRFLLGLKDPRKAKFADVILGHAAAIEGWLETKRYVECGWPCYAAIEYFAQRFAGRIRIVHLVRHPIPTATSMLTHSYYRDDVPSVVNTAGLLQPTDAGVSFPDYRDRWARMGRLAKCLYFWMEVNALGLRLERELGVPFLRLKFEELFQADGLDRLLDFLELPRRAAIYAARTHDFDRWHQYTTAKIKPSVIGNHPQIMAVAKQLGYDPLDVDLERLLQRYEETQERKGQKRSPLSVWVDASGREIDTSKTSPMTPKDPAASGQPAYRKAPAQRPDPKE